MLIFKQASLLQRHLTGVLPSQKTIGFVPTMGALHAGHLSLLQKARAQNDLVVCSIFVNPTQFNNPSDFLHYPKTIEQDLEVLMGAGCDILFLPPVAEVYPEGHIKKHFDLGVIETVLEGAHRPGHFQGVCEVVDRLLSLVTPHDLYLGQKDFQQCMVINQLLTITSRSLPQLHICPTLREEDGLAMSSRNLRLSMADRQTAPTLYKVLEKIKAGIAAQPLNLLEQSAVQELTSAGFVVDYVAVCNTRDLQKPTGPDQPWIALAAASLNGIRLIDNLPLN